MQYSNPIFSETSWHPLSTDPFHWPLPHHPHRPIRPTITWNSLTFWVSHSCTTSSFHTVFPPSWLVCVASNAKFFWTIIWTTMLIFQLSKDLNHICCQNWSLSPCPYLHLIYFELGKTRGYLTSKFWYVLCRRPPQGIVGIYISISRELEAKDFSTKSTFLIFFTCWHPKMKVILFSLIYSSCIFFIYPHWKIKYHVVQYRK